MKKVIAAAFAVAFVVTGSAAPLRPPQGSAEPAGAGSVARRIGSINAIAGGNIRLAPDSGPQVSVTVDPSTQILRIAPGEKNLRNATRLQFEDLQVGDRILVAGKPGSDSNSIAASSVVVMKRSDVEARQQHDREDWQKRGLGGLVFAVEPASGTITISVPGFTGNQTVIVHTSKDTVIRRYAPDSVKFDDAKLSTLEAIKPGDQLRARGNRSDDGSELTAGEVVAGRFRNIVGTINSVDPSTGTLSVQDLLTHKPLQVKVAAESQLRKLPAPAAQRIAMRLKGTPGTPGTENNAGSASSAPGTSDREGGMEGRSRSGGAPDFQQMLGRMPAASLADLQKGDAVMIVSTEGAASSGGTVITLLSGVEPILQAAPGASPSSMLTPWSLSAPAGDAANQ
jgi:hypothetical protein